MKDSALALAPGARAPLTIEASLTSWRRLSLQLQHHYSSWLRPATWAVKGEVELPPRPFLFSQENDLREARHDAKKCKAGAQGLRQRRHAQAARPRGGGGVTQGLGGGGHVPGNTTPPLKQAAAGTRTSPSSSSASSAPAAATSSRRTCTSSRPPRSAYPSRCGARRAAHSWRWIAAPRPVLRWPWAWRSCRREREARAPADATTCQHAESREGDQFWSARPGKCR